MRGSSAPTLPPESSTMAAIVTMPGGIEHEAAAAVVDGRAGGECDRSAVGGYDHAGNDRVIAKENLKVRRVALIEHGPGRNCMVGASASVAAAMLHV